MENLLDELDFKDLVDTGTSLDFNPSELTPPEENVETTDIGDNPKPEENIEVNFEELLENSEEVGKNSVESTEAPPPKTQSKQTSSNVPLLLFKSLLEGEALTEFDEEEYNKDVAEHGEAIAAQNVFIRELELNRKALTEQMEEDFKEYVALKDAGVDTETAKNLISSKVQFNTLKPEELSGDDKLELRKQLLTQKYKLTTQFSDKEIEKAINRTIASGDDEEDAVEALEIVNNITRKNIEVERQKAVQAEAARKLQYEENIAKYKATINALDEPFPGVKINKQTKEKIEKTIMSGEIWEYRKKDPAKFDSVLGAFYIQGGFEGKFKIGESKIKSSATKELERILKNTKPAEFNSNTNLGTENDADDKVVFDIIKNRKKTSL